jgi:lipoate-protein ligase A
MALDALLLSQRRPALRLYRWGGRPTLSLGLHQRPIESHWLALAQAGRLDLVRRPSGGRAVLHGGDLSYALVWPDAPGCRRQAYLEACAWLQLAFGRMGLPLRFGHQPARRQQPSCFATSTAADLVHLPTTAAQVALKSLAINGAVINDLDANAATGDRAIDEVIDEAIDESIDEVIDEAIDGVIDEVIDESIDAGALDSVGIDIVGTKSAAIDGLGVKRIGSAQHWRSGCLLQHGTILLAPPAALWQELFGGPAPALPPLPLASEELESLLLECAAASFPLAPVSELTVQELAAIEAARPSYRVDPQAAG